MAALRLLSTDHHDDGLNAWQIARVAPPPHLAGSIAGYSDYRERTGGFTSRRELPHAEGVLIFNLGAPIAITAGDGQVLRLRAGEAFVAGVHLRPALSHSQGEQAGTHVFLPLATLRRLLGVPMSQLLDQVIGLDTVLGASARALGARLVQADLAQRVALLDDALGRRLAAAPPPDRQQAYALHSLRTRPNCDIADIARDVGWSRKHFASRIKDAVGVGPRCFRRLLRFQSLTAAIGVMGDNPDWAGLAHETGYCDQSHMIREFREFSGLTPSTYVARSLPHGGGVLEG
jgi:AraC-like DNA-binding protein